MGGAISRPHSDYGNRRGRPNRPSRWPVKYATDLGIETFSCGLLVLSSRYLAEEALDLAAQIGGDVGDRLRCFEQPLR